MLTVCFDVTVGLVDLVGGEIKMFDNDAGRFNGWEDSRFWRVRRRERDVWSHDWERGDGWERDGRLLTVCRG